MGSAPSYLVTFQVTNLWGNDWAAHVFNGDDRDKFWASSQDDRFNHCETTTFTCTDTSSTPTCQLRIFKAFEGSYTRDNIKNGDHLYFGHTGLKMANCPTDDCPTIFAGDGQLSEWDIVTKWPECWGALYPRRLDGLDDTENEGSVMDITMDNTNVQEHTFVEHVLGAESLVATTTTTTTTANEVVTTNLRGAGASRNENELELN